MGRSFTVDDIPRFFEVVQYDVSPGGNSIAFTWNRAGKPDIFLKSLSEDEPVKLSGGQESFLEPSWAPDGRSVTCVSDVGGSETFGIYSVTSETKETDSILRDEFDNSSPGWSKNGDLLAFLSNRGGDNLNLYLLEARSSEILQISRGRAPVFSYAWSPNSKYLAYARSSEVALHEDQIWLADVHGKPRQVLGDRGVSYELTDQCWSPQSDKLLFTSDENDFRDIGVLDVRSGEKELIVRSKHDKHYARWSPIGDKICYVENIDGNLVLHVRHLADGHTETVSLREGVAFDPKWSSEGKSLFFNHMGHDRPPDVWVSGEHGVKRVTNSVPSDYEEIIFVKAKRISYNSFDGLSVKCCQYTPVRGDSSAGIVLPHGGPEAQHLNGWQPLTQVLVSGGYTVLAPDYRGSTGYGRKFLKISDHDLGGGDLRDVIEAARFFRNQSNIGRKIAIVGGSYGGYIAMMALTKFPNIWAAGVSLVGFFNWKTEYEKEREYLQYYDSLKVGTPETNPDFFYDRSPINFVDRILAPVLILHGENDPRCPVGEAKQIISILAQKSVPHDYKFYPDEGHGFRKLANRLDAYKRILGFLEKHLMANIQAEQKPN